MASKNHIRAKWLDFVSPCPYLPDREALMEYALVEELNAQDYAGWINERWRKMGSLLFRPQCIGCQACEPVRILASKFQPKRIHKRIMRTNADLQLRISKAEVTDDQVDLADRYEISRQEKVGWPASGNSASQFLRWLSTSPVPVQQWCLYEGNRLVAFCIVDELPDGFSAVNSFWEPQLMRRSLGVYVILSLISEAQRRQLPHIYLGYYVAGCRSMEYKARFEPMEVLVPNKGWQHFQSR